jgi:thiamine-monophosphate kinase
MEMEIVNVEALMEGIVQVLDRYGAVLVGGNVDINRLEVVGVAWGHGHFDGLVRRAGAKVGDKVLVTCELGVGWAAYLALRLGLLNKLPNELADMARRYKNDTYAPAAAILEAAEGRLWTSGMDLSDGLIEFLYTILERNGVGVCIDAELLGDHPLIHAVAELLGVQPFALALEPGYDFPFAHAYTVSPHRIEEVLAIFRRQGSACLVVGEVITEEIVIVERDGTSVPIPTFWSDQIDDGETRIRRWQQEIASNW